MKFRRDRFAVSGTTHSGDAKLQKFEDFYGYYKNLKIFMDIKCADLNIRCEYFNIYRFEQKL